MIRGTTIIVHSIPIYLHEKDTEPMNPNSLKLVVCAGGQWRTGDIQHIALVGPAELSVDEIKHRFDALTDEQWICAHTLASDGWHGTPEELISAAKELS